MNPLETPSAPVSSCYVLLRGTGELAEGQTLRIAEGQSVVVGRSRWCDWSLKRSPAYLKSRGAARRDVQRSLLYASVSRRHVRITLHASDRVEIENLGGNGMLVDGDATDRIVLDDVLERVHTIQLGPRGPILELGPGSLPI
ncbi:MAG: FHA domain-containing protein [Planctomycetota bacterium]